MEKFCEHVFIDLKFDREIIMVKEFEGEKPLIFVLEEDEL